jgi:GNAT superfamily N-acetyltransferase
VSLTYREAKIEDLPFIIAQIVEDSVTPLDEDVTASDPHYAAAFNTIAADPNHELWIVEADGAPVASFLLSYIPGIMRRGGWRGMIEGVHVVPSHRNRGIGEAMMRWAVERCRQRGCVLVQLTSNKQRKDAHRFYERLGFVASHEGYKLTL